MNDHATSDTFLSRTNVIRAGIGALLVLLAVLLPGDDSRLAGFPKDWTIDLATPLGDSLTHLSRKAMIGSIRVGELTRGLGAVVSQPYELLKGIVATGFSIYPESGGKWTIPALPWTAVTAVFVIVAQGFGGRNLALGTLASFVFFAVFGIWESAMLTLTLVVVSVLFGTSLGLLLGLWGYRSRFFDRAMQPVYDIMQTLPLFSYLVPMILFFGFGPVASLMATVVFALPPMARITTQALHEVHASVKEFGQIVGCKPRQLNWQVLIPAARRSLLLGVNQVIMLALSVVVVASLIGAGGLGGDVLRSLKSMRIGDAIVSGTAVTLMAIMLDRISFAIAMRRPVHSEQALTLLQRHALAVKCVVAVLTCIALAQVTSAIQTFPEAWQIHAGDYANDAVSWLSKTYHAELGAWRDWFIVFLLKPTKLFLTGLPWIGVVVFVGVLGYLLGGWRLMLLGLVIFLLIGVNGYWDRAMISLYLVLVSVFSAAVVGVALGVLGALNKPIREVLIVSVDTLQTMPMFIYLIPVVMLFSVGEFPAYIAIVLFAVTPAIRYTISALERVDAALVDAALMSGCSRWQLMTQVQLPLGLPTLLLGLNQVIMFAFGMLVITALVGTRGLEETTLLAIAQVRAGEGLLAGLAISGMAIVSDRYLRAASRIAAYHMGVTVAKYAG